MRITGIRFYVRPLLSKSGWLWLLFLCLTSPQIHAQTFSQHHIGVHSGLPTYYVKAVIQDSHGFMWIGTDDGLVRYDGKTSRAFTNQVPSPFIKYFHKTRDGNVLMVSDGGLSKIFTEIQNPHIKTLVKGDLTRIHSDYLYYPKSVFIDSKERIWVTESIGIVQVTDSGITRHRFETRYRSLDPFLRIFYFFETEDAVLYVVSQTGHIFVYDEVSQEFVWQQHIPIHPSPDILDIVYTDDAELIVGGDTGIYRIRVQDNEPTWEKLHHIPRISAMSIRENGDIYIASKTSGLHYLRSGNYDQTPLHVLPLQSYGINYMMLDHHENLWVSSDQGVLLIRRKAFSSVLFPQDYQYTNSIFITEENHIYAVNEQYLVRIFYDQNEQPYLQNVHESNTGDIVSITGLGEHLWYTTNGGYVHKLEKTRRVADYPLHYFSFHETYHGFNSLADHNGNVWIIAHNTPGLIRIAPDNGLELHFENQAVLRKPLSMIEDPQNNRIFVSGEFDHLSLSSIDTRTLEIQTSTAPEIFASNSDVIVHDLSLDSKGGVLMATNKGVFRFADGKFEYVEIHRNLNPNMLVAIALDSLDNIWAGAYNGVFLKTDSTSISFDRTDGISSLTIRFRAMKIDAQNRIWMGTSHGLNFLQAPKNTFYSTPKPGIIQYEDQGIWQEVTPAGVRIREHTNKAFQVHTLSYPHEKLDYEYKILGYSTQWMQSETNDFILLQRLPRGSYELHLRAQKRGHPVSASVIIPLRVSPVWYNTIWAHIGAILFTILFVLSYIRFNRAQNSRMEAEKRLHEAQKQLQTVLLNTPMILISLNHEGLITHAEGQGLRSLALDSSSIVGLHFTKLFDNKETQDSIAQILEGDELGQGLFRSGHQTFQFEFLVRLNQRNMPDGVLGVGVDITDRISIEQELIEARNTALGEREKAEQEKEKAVQADQAKSLFLANMSHELRTPLNAILGFSQLMKSDAEIDSKYRNYANIMFQSGEHLLGMINDILDLSKIEAGRLELNPEITDIHYLFSELQHLFQFQAESKGLLFKVKTEANVPKHVRVDSGKLKQILINLIGNAIKFTAAGKVIIATSYDNGRLHISVSDTGKGIPNTMLEKIFQPFEQVQDGFRQGTGLGLAISKKLANLMEGTLAVFSTPGKGSEFILNFPCPQVHNYESPETATTILANQVTGFTGADQLHVLVVDDIFDNRMLVTAMLSPLGITCDEATNGLEATQMVEKKKYDLIIMDIVMPVMDGKEAQTRIAAMESCKNIPIIALTASGLKRDQRTLLKQGFKAYIRKPFYLSELLTCIEQLCDIQFVYRNVETPAADPKITDSLGKSLAMALKEEPAEVFGAIKEAAELTDFDAVRKEISKCHTIPEFLKNQSIESLQSKDFRFLMDLSEEMEQL